jgi:nucleoside-triphosphatase THEP1
MLRSPIRPSSVAGEGSGAYMSARGTIADIAALVYSSGDRPDLVLREFAGRLADAGHRTCGLIQLRDRSFDGTRRRVMVLDGWQVVDVACKSDLVGNSHCRFDGDWLDRMGVRVKASIRRGVDAVIVNRFGPLEVAGRGFRDAIMAASETETPLIIAVPEFEFARWTRFSNGMTIRLDCTLEPLLEWWHRLSSHSARETKLDRRACELLK